MQGIVSSLKESELFISIDVIELIDEESVKLLKVKAQREDGSVLYITELHTPNFQKYSYHWQDDKGKLIIRWDNKPHWKNLKTFPYHKHINDQVSPSQRIDIQEVIEIIKRATPLSALPAGSPRDQ